MTERDYAVGYTIAVHPAFSITFPPYDLIYVFHGCHTIPLFILALLIPAFILLAGVMHLPIRTLP